MGVKVFQMWDWIRAFNGNNNDWTKCVPGCLKHHYSIEAKQALLEMRIINDVNELATAKPEYHRVCRIGCDRHVGGRCSTIVNQSEANMAQHMTRKYSALPGLVTLFRFVYFIIFNLISSHFISFHLIQCILEKLRGWNYTILSDQN